jgi:MFS family permease
VLHVLVLSAFQGIVTAIDMPARQAFVVEMIEDRADLPNAIALNSSMVNAARLIGPSVGGILIASVGEGWCFLIDSVSYVAVVLSLLAMRVVPPAARRTSGDVLSELREGFRYVAGFTPIRAVLLLLALVSLMGMPYSVLMPIMASRVLAGGPHTLGFLMAAAGSGALLGTLYLASRPSVIGLGRINALAACGFGVALIAFAQSRVLPLSLFLTMLAGMGMMIHLSASNTILQTIVDEDKRGRVMSFYATAFFGTVPFGSLFAGTLAERIGVPSTLSIGGLVCIAGGLLFLRELPEIRRVARPIYIRLGIIPDDTASVPTPAPLAVPPEE